MYTHAPKIEYCGWPEVWTHDRSADLSIYFREAWMLMSSLSWLRSTTASSTCRTPNNHLFLLQKPAETNNWSLPLLFVMVQLYINWSTCKNHTNEKKQETTRLPLQTNSIPTSKVMWKGMCWCSCPTEKLPFVYVATVDMNVCTNKSKDLAPFSFSRLENL